MSDHEVLALRGEGLSYAAIASRLSLPRSRDAFNLFHRALQASDVSAKPELMRAEFARLDSLEARIRTRDAAEPDKMNSRLQALERMRERIASADGS